MADNRILSAVAGFCRSHSCVVIEMLKRKNKEISGKTKYPIRILGCNDSCERRMPDLCRNFFQLAVHGTGGRTLLQETCMFVYKRNMEAYLKRRVSRQEAAAEWVENYAPEFFRLYNKQHTHGYHGLIGRCSIYQPALEQGNSSEEDCGEFFWQADSPDAVRAAGAMSHSLEEACHVGA